MDSEDITQLTKLYNDMEEHGTPQDTVELIGRVLREMVILKARCDQYGLPISAEMLHRQMFANNKLRAELLLLQDKIDKFDDALADAYQKGQMDVLRQF